MNWIKEIMDDRGVTIEEMAEILDLSERTVKGYYMGWNKPGRIVKLNLMKIFDLEEDDLEE